MKGTLILIPARAGSKGLPGKNVKLLGDWPLITHSILFAKQIADDQNDIICISTNDDSVINIAKELNIDVPFKRPEALATDEIGSYEVIMHALKYYEDMGKEFKNVLLLQPTSPFRKLEDFEQINSLYRDEYDMVVSVSISKSNPYFNLFEEDSNGYLTKSKESNVIRRQDCPNVYAYNGSFYLMNVASLKKGNLQSFTKVIKSIMPENRSIDIDNAVDWKIAEFLLKETNNENS